MHPAWLRCAFMLDTVDAYFYSNLQFSLFNHIFQSCFFQTGLIKLSFTFSKGADANEYP